MTIGTVLCLVAAGTMFGFVVGINVGVWCETYDNSIGKRR